MTAIDRVGHLRSARDMMGLRIAEPAERPYGIEATLRDVSGNLISLTQRFPDPTF